MCDQPAVHRFFEYIGSRCPCNDEHHTEKGMPSYSGGPAPNLAQGRAEQGQTAANPVGVAQDPIQGGQVYGEQDGMRQSMATQSQGHALPGSLFPAIGLGGQTPTGQRLVMAESGPSNPTFPPTWQEQAETDISTRLEEMDEVIHAVEELYAQNPGLISRLEEQAGFSYDRTKEMLHEMQEEQDRISEIIRQNGKLGKYQRKLMALREKIPKTVRKLEALGALPTQKPEQSGPMGTQPSGSWREDGEAMPLHPQTGRTGEGSELQPDPQSPSGIAAQQQRAGMRSKEARLNFEAGVRAAAKGLILELVAADIMKVPESTKKAKITKSITGQLPPVSEFVQMDSDADHSTTFRVTKHKHFHSKDCVRCECGYPDNLAYHLGVE